MSKNSWPPFHFLDERTGADHKGLDGWAPGCERGAQRVQGESRTTKCWAQPRSWEPWVAHHWCGRPLHGKQVKGRRRFIVLLDMYTWSTFTYLHAAFMENGFSWQIVRSTNPDAMLMCKPTFQRIRKVLMGSKADRYSGLEPRRNESSPSKTPLSS